MSKKHRKKTRNHHVQERKYKKLSIILSVCSLILSLVTLFLTSPVIYDYFKRPNIQIWQIPPDMQRNLSQNRYITTVFIYNKGRSAGTNLKLTLDCFKNDNIKINTSLLYNKTEQEIKQFPKGVFLKTIVISFVNFPPKGNAIITISGTDMDQFINSKSFIKKNKDNVLFDGLFFPSVMSAIFDQGTINIMTRSKPI